MGRIGLANAAMSIEIARNKAGLNDWIHEKAKK